MGLPANSTVTQKFFSTDMVWIKCQQQNLLSNFFLTHTKFWKKIWFTVSFITKVKFVLTRPYQQLLGDPSLCCRYRMAPFWNIDAKISTSLHIKLSLIISWHTQFSLIITLHTQFSLILVPWTEIGRVGKYGLIIKIEYAGLKHRLLNFGRGSNWEIGFNPNIKLKGNKSEIFSNRVLLGFQPRICFNPKSVYIKSAKYQGGILGWGGLLLLGRAVIIYCEIDISRFGIIR